MRLTSDWKRYYLNDPIIDEPIKSFTKLSLETWTLANVKELKLNKKQYMNMSHIIRDCLNMAVEEGIIEENFYSRVRINRKLYRPTNKKESKTQVYIEKEQKMIFESALEDFRCNPTDTTPLAVMLAFLIGTRPVSVPTDGLKIVDMDKAVNKGMGTSEGYLFNRDGKPIRESVVAYRLEKYCKHLKIKYRCPHKIRKTYISAMTGGKTRRLKGSCKM